MSNQYKMKETSYKASNKKQKASRPFPMGKFVFICAALLIGILIVKRLAPSLNSNRDKYTVFNYTSEGTSLLYDTLSKMGFNVVTDYSKIKRENPINDAQIIIEPYSSQISEADDIELLSYIYRGGRAIYLTDLRFEYIQILLMNLDIEVLYFQSEYALISYGLGEIFVGPSAYISNQELLLDWEAGYMVADVLTRWNPTAVKFNEAYHGYIYEPDLWALLPVNLKNIIYQLIIILVLIVWKHGKTFGSPIPDLRSGEAPQQIRQETEYLKTLAGIYKNSGNGYIVFEWEFNAFLKRSAEFFGLWEGLPKRQLPYQCLNQWKINNLPYRDDFQELIAFSESESDFNIKKKSGREKLYKAQLIIKRLNQCVSEWEM